MKYIIMLFLLGSVCFAQVDSLQTDSLGVDSLMVDTVKVEPTVKYITSYDSTELAGINMRIAEALKDDFNTSCTEYAKLIKHPDRDEWALEIDLTDSRKPYAYLTDVELPRLCELPKDWGL